MKIEKINVGEQLFAPIFLDYLQQKEELKPFYSKFPDLQNFEQVLSTRQLAPEIRDSLVKSLKKQYRRIDATPDIQKTIDQLADPKTFTVTTGHQLNLFTGPAYFIYKIITTIGLARQLRKTYPAYQFVPVYWMASEDHDFEEINHFHLFGEKYSWHTNQKGPVGRFSTTDLHPLLADLKESVPVFKEAYQQNDNLAQATLQLVHHLFGKEGLLVLDADEAELKKHFKDIMHRDILDQQTKPLVENCTAELGKYGYSAPVHVREINFFYLDDGLRERIVQEENNWKVLNTDLTWSKQELAALIDKQPEKFSPNVVLRPVYQEMILPNLAYIGGPSEVAYWLQLKPAFDHYEVNYPLIFPRNFALIINKTNLKKIQKLELQWIDLFLDLDKLKNKYVIDNTNGLLDLEDEKVQLETIFSSLKEKAVQIDQSLKGWIGSEESKTLKTLENIQKRLKKAEKNNQDTALRQLENIKSRLWPEGNLQERHDNILNFYINNSELLDFLLKTFDPFDFRFNLVLEDD